MQNETGKGDALYVRSPDVVYRKVAGEQLLVPVRAEALDTEKLYVLDAVGSRIWQALAVPASIAEVARLVAGEFDVSAAQACEDTAAFVADLVSVGLVSQP